MEEGRAAKWGRGATDAFVDRRLSKGEKPPLLVFCWVVVKYVDERYAGRKNLFLISTTEPAAV